jgi:hypothetical protein
MSTSNNRALEIGQLLHEIYSVDAEGHYEWEKFQALTVLLEVSKLEQDTEALTTAQEGLQHICENQMKRVDTTANQSISRGRTLQMIDEVGWFLQLLASMEAQSEDGLRQRKEDEQLVLNVLRNEGALNSADRVAQQANAQLPIDTPRVLAALESLEAQGLINTVAWAHTKLYGPKKEQPVRA